MSRLKLITTTPNDEGLWIRQEEGEDPVLEYSGIKLDKGGSPISRLVKCSDLVRVLSQDFIKGTKFIVNTYDPVLSYLFPGDPTIDSQFTTSTKFIPQISTTELSREEVDGFSVSGLDGITQDSVRSIKACDSWYNDPIECAEVEVRIEESIVSVFGKFLNFEDLDYEKEVRNKVGEYSSDITSIPLTVSLISDTTYTDTINLEDWVYKSSNPEVTAKLDISFMYSIGGNIYGGFQTIQPFKYSDLGYLTSNNQVMTVGKIQLEYIGYVLKIYPLDPEIGEVVINDCVLTIGKL